MRLIAPLLSLCLALLVGAAAPAPPPETRPNFLFVMIDDLGFADFSVTGNRIVATPNIDRLAADGLLMTQFYVASPICSPSRAGFMTGRFPARVGFVSFIDDRAHNHAMHQADWLDPKLPTLPRMLARAGYATGHFGKWHLGGGRDIGEAPLPAAYGFDESYVQFEGLGPRVLMTEDHYGLASRSAALGRGPVDRLPKGLISARYVDKALAFVRRQRRPWFVQLWLDDVHDPYAPTPEQLAAVRGKGRDAEHERFLAVLVAADREIGRLVAGLRAAGEFDRTLIVLTGDNGPTAAEGYYRGGGEPPGDTGSRRGRKASLYEGGIREPLIVRWPGAAPAGTRDGVTVASAVDLMPTFAALAGAAVPPGGDGVSLAAAWRGRPQPRRPDLFWAYGQFGAPGASPSPTRPSDRSPAFAVRAGRWKLLADAGGTGAELYDLHADPSETRNVAAKEMRIARVLRQRLERWRRTLPLSGSSMGRPALEFYPAELAQKVIVAQP